MNDLFSGSFSRLEDQDLDQIRSPAADDNLNQFFNDVEAVKDEIRELESLHSQLRAAHEKSQTLHDSGAVKSLRSSTDADVAAALKKAKGIKLRLESLDRSNSVNRSAPGCGPGSSAERTRTFVVNGLRRKLRDAMGRFNDLRQRIGAEYRETVRRRYFAVAGEDPGEEVLDRLIETGESETFLQKATMEQGRGRVADTIVEIQERHGAVKEMARSLAELHRVFLDMAVLVESQGEQLEDIEDQVLRAQSFVRGGTEQLQIARQHQRSSRKWVWAGVLVLLVVILVVVLIVVLSVRPWQQKK